MSYAQIYVMNADGSDQTKLLEKSGMSSQPTWSPNSKEIAFALFGADDGGCSIYSMDADGLGNRSTLAALEECLAIDSLAWSPDGRKIALEVTGDYDTADIWVVKVSGRTGETNQPRQLTHAPHSWRNVNPTWSPDGTKIAFAGDRDIYTIDVNTLKETRLTNSADFEHDPTWSADGEQIAFVRDNSATSSSAIYVMRFDGSDLSLVRNFQLGDGEMEYDGRTIRLDWRSLP